MRKILNSRAICRVRSRVADVVSFLEKVHVASRENTRDRTRGIKIQFKIFRSKDGANAKVLANGDLF